ncbi:MAG TPA: hypothetical protein VFR67_29665 [Pilimelia sp.]|nr:hypothetical protein [Pilimelia sp.]
MSKVKWVTSAAMLACTGALVACQAGAGTAPVTGAGTGTAPGAAPHTTAVRSENPAAGGASSPVGTTDPILSGKREVTIVRVQAFESGLSLLNGRLVEVDDDSGRQLFVPTPLGGDRHLIKAYDRPNNHPAADEPSCWQVHNPDTTESLTIQAAACDADNRDQWFTITAKGERTYAISNASAFLQHSPASGLILEELGDAPLRSTFRFVDNGPARRPAGG